MNMEPSPSTQMPLGNAGRVNFLREEMLDTPGAAEEDWSLPERGLVMHVVTTGCLTPSISCGAKRLQLQAVVRRPSSMPALTCHRRDLPGHSPRVTRIPSD